MCAIFYYLLFFFSTRLLYTFLLFCLFIFFPYASLNFLSSTSFSSFSFSAVSIMLDHTVASASYSPLNVPTAMSTTPPLTTSPTSPPLTTSPIYNPSPAPAYDLPVQLGVASVRAIHVSPLISILTSWFYEKIFPPCVFIYSHQWLASIHTIHPFDHAFIHLYI